MSFHDNFREGYLSAPTDQDQESTAEALRPSVHYHEKEAVVGTPRRPLETRRVSVAGPTVIALGKICVGNDHVLFVSNASPLISSAGSGLQDCLRSLVPQKHRKDGRL